MVTRTELFDVGDQLSGLHSRLMDLYEDIEMELSIEAETKEEARERMRDFKFSDEIRDAQNRLFKLESYLTKASLEGNEIRALEETKLFLDTEMARLLEGLGDYKRWNSEHWHSEITNNVDKQIQKNLASLNKYTDSAKELIDETINKIRKDRMDPQKFKAEAEAVQALKKSMEEEEKEMEAQEQERHEYHNVLVTLIVLAVAFSFLTMFSTPSTTTGRAVLPVTGFAGFTFGSMYTVMILSAVMLAVLLKVFGKI